LKSRGIPLIINDRVDVALATGADGVHLGQSDMPLAVARRSGEVEIIGVSAESLRDAAEAEEEGADYLGISPIFATATKTDTAALGLRAAGHPPGSEAAADRHRRPGAEQRR
jgi:thiamine-phosphate pyrophosphorylase